MNFIHSIQHKHLIQKEHYIPQVTDLGSHQYKKSSSAFDMLPSTKNPNYTPHYMETKPFSFTFYNPYTNTIPNMKKVNPLYICNNSHINLISKQNSSHLPFNFCPCIHQYLESKENRCNHSVPDDISQDSAISIDDNLNDYPSIPDESYNTSKSSILRTDSGIDMSTKYSSMTSTNDLSASKQTNFLAPSTVLNMYSAFPYSFDYSNKRIGNIVSDVISNENRDNGNAYTRSGLHNFKSSTLCKKKVTRYLSNHCSNSKAHLLKFCKNTQCPHSSIFLNKKITTPRRYIKWSKAKSCISIHKITSPDKFKFKRIHSHPNLLSQYDSELNDSLLHNSPTRKRRNNFLNTCKLNSSILSKFNRLNFSPILKQYVVVSPCHQIPEIHQKQKYTPLPSPLPVHAKVAELSNPKLGARNIFASDGKYSNISSKLCPMKGDRLKSEKQEDKTLSLVLLLF